MVQTTITPKKTDLDISILLPDAYVGKEVHVLIYTDDEVNNTPAAVLPKRKPSDYAGTLSKETAHRLLKEIEKSRNEWGQDI